MGLFWYIADMRLDLEWVGDTAWRRANHPWMVVPRRNFSQLHFHYDIRSTYFVYVIQFVFVILMIVAMYLNDWKFKPIHVNPLLGPSAEVLLKLGALNSEVVIKTMNGISCYPP